MNSSDMQDRMGVICIKSNARDKEGLKTFATQIAQIASNATLKGIKVVDIVISSSGSQNILKQLKRVDDTTIFNYVLIYSPNQICNSLQEYKTFLNEVGKFDADVLYLRTPY